MIKEPPLWQRAARSVHHALSEFLSVPIAVVAAFLALAAGIYFIDAALWSANNEQAEGALRRSVGVLNARSTRVPRAG
jgi:hypothetical protein